METGETFEHPEPSFPFGSPQTVAPCSQKENSFRGTHLYLKYCTKNEDGFGLIQTSPHTEVFHTQTSLAQMNWPLPLQLESVAKYSKMQDSWVNCLSFFSYCNNSENLEFNFVPFSLSLILKFQQSIDFHTFIQIPMLVQGLYFTRTNALVKNSCTFSKNY